ncbi:hypothetical protein C7974DRAFT_105180 [Boeremia exigua]|uniref:uncharacterized protein n=1 Tax=Boeremia exigua TaxID=749465 RepID=UPI001E8CC042|nr:uncharacterized protein C7974DRAFT_105180 [Boeremia exigua]KAH6642599.1 hypothetical protein C7974DRAFT_105180 [Boeremia exigua]
MSSTMSPEHLDAEADDFCYAYSVTSVAPNFPTNITSPSLSLHRSYSGHDSAIFNHGCLNNSLAGTKTQSLMVYTQIQHGAAPKSDDVVGQYLAQRAALANIMEGLQAPGWNYVNVSAGYNALDQPKRVNYDSYASEQPFQRRYPDLEGIRHLHTLHSLLPHIQPVRKLNALSSLELDIIEVQTDNIFCRAVPKKMLVLFLGRDVVRKFLHTVQRENNEAWLGIPTQQIFRVPQNIASSAAITILVSWMLRACKFATMHAMEPIRIPNNLLAACSLARTMEAFGLHKDASRVDISISQQFLRRPLYAVEIETLWRCLGETSKYVYGCVKAFSTQSRNPKMSEEFRILAERCPRLHARIRDPALNEEYRPQFGRKWFQKLTNENAQHVQIGISGLGVRTDNDADTRSWHSCAERTQALEIHTRSVRALNPCASDFWPMGTEC